MSRNLCQVETCQVCNRTRIVDGKGTQEWTYEPLSEKLSVAGYAIITCEDCERNTLVGSATQGDLLDWSGL